MKYNFKTMRKYQNRLYFPSTIVEVKYLAGDVDIASQIIRSSPFQATRASKYVIGIQRLHEL